MNRSDIIREFVECISNRPTQSEMFDEFINQLRARSIEVEVKSPTSFCANLGQSFIGEIAKCELCHDIWIISSEHHGWLHLPHQYLHAHNYMV